MKKLAIFFGLVLAVLIVIAGTMRAGLWNPSYESMKAKYAGPPSRFVTINGVQVHLRDEGQGPVIVMVHSSMSDLHIWDDLAAPLIKTHRVVRFDWPPYGLSIDPTENFSMERAVALLGGVVDELKLDRFVLIASSSGATLSTIYASEHPDRVMGLALSSLPLALPPDGKTDWHADAIRWVQQRVSPDYVPRFYYDFSVGFLVGDRRNLSDQEIQWYYETNNIPGRARMIGKYLAANMKSLWRTGATDAAAQVEKPILLQWGDSDPVLPAYLGDKAAADFRKAKVTLIHYPNVGHYPMIEIPEKLGADIATWLAALETPAP